MDDASPEGDVLFNITAFDLAGNNLTVTQTNLTSSNLTIDRTNPTLSNLTIYSNNPHNTSCKLQVVAVQCQICHGDVLNITRLVYYCKIENVSRAVWSHSYYSTYAMNSHRPFLIAIFASVMVNASQV